MKTGILSAIDAGVQARQTAVGGRL